MKAENLTGKSPGGKRQKLVDILPLDTPLVVQIFPVYSCILRCNFCLFSKPRSEHGFISNKINLDFDLYKKFVQDFKQFPNKAKIWRIVGIGEPLMWKYIAESIVYTKINNVCEKMEIITNAVLLNKKMSDNLIKAGLDRMVVSLQGITSEQYSKTSGKDINIKNIIENLTYYYKNKKENQTLYIKIADVALENKEDEKKFFDIFGNICDNIAIENIVPLHDIKYLKDMPREKKVTQFGADIKNIEVCSVPFYMIQLNPDGNIVPCYSWDYPYIMGNANNESIYDIWNSEQYKLDFQKKMLLLGRKFNLICDDCTMCIYRYHEEDDLDEDREKLLEMYK